MIKIITIAGVHIALWVASRCARLEGDFVECGVNYGLNSSAIMHHLNWNKLGKNFLAGGQFRWGKSLKFPRKHWLSVMKNALASIIVLLTEPNKTFLNGQVHT